jgi:hypothetical protein
MRRAMILLAILLSAACGARQANDGASDDAVASEPEWSSCVVEDEFDTCAEVCAAEGMACAAAGCPAEPMYCKPDSCDMATSMLSLGDAICSDPTVGVFVAAACEDPIEFIFTDTARCCCEG